MAALDYYINDAKANLFHEVGGIARAKQNANQYDRIADFLNLNGAVAAFMQFEEIQGLFRNTHERLYQALDIWDREIVLCGAGRGKQVTWASSYSQWMSRYSLPIPPS